MIGYNIKVLQQTVWLVVNLITVGNFYFAFFLTLHCVCICPTQIMLSLQRYTFMGEAKQVTM